MHDTYLLTYLLTYRIAAEPNRRKYRVWNSHGHVTTLLMAIPDKEISAVRFFAVLCGWTIVTSYSIVLSVWRIELWIGSAQLYEQNGTTFNPLHLSRASKLFLGKCTTVKCEKIVSKKIKSKCQLLNEYVGLYTFGSDWQHRKIFRRCLKIVSK